MEPLLPPLELPINQRALERYPSEIPDPTIEPSLHQLSETMLLPYCNQDAELARCAQAGLWLLHGYWDQSHSISQSLSSPEGSFWHAIMHRLEGDFWNSKYWYRQVGRHPVFESMGQQMGIGQAWSPLEFVDQCAAEAKALATPAGSSNSLRKSVQEVALAEWMALFQFCLPQLDLEDL